MTDRQKLKATMILRFYAFSALVLILYVMHSNVANGTEYVTGVTSQGLEFRALGDVPVDISIENICCSDEYLFPDPPVAGVQIGYGVHALWLKVELPSNTGLIQLRPILDDVTLFVQSGSDGNWVSVRTGDMVANSEKSIVSPFMALPLPESTSGRTAYLRVIQTTSITVRISFWSIPEFVTMQTADQALKTYLFGFISALIVYNVIVSLLIRDPAFLLNALAIISLLVFSLYLSGYGAVFVWSQWTGWSNAIQIISLFCSIVFGSFFAWIFIGAKRDELAKNWLLLVTPIFATTGLVAALFLPFRLVQLWMLIGGVCFIVTNCWYMIKRFFGGDTKAMIYLTPFVAAIVPGIILLILQKVFGLETRYFDNNLLEMMLGVEAVLFSLALASRIRLTEQATNEMNTKLLAVKNESLAKTIAAQDSERQRIAQELHDGVGQDFLAVVGSLKQIAKEGQTSNRVTSIPDLINSANGALDELRRISKDMHPASIAHLGLANAIHALIENLGATYQIETESQIIFNEGDLDSVTKLHIYRIIQECLSNISRHAGASCCRTRLIVVGENIELTVEDDGSGPDPGFYENIPTTGLGFTSIGERVSALDGVWNISKSELGGLKVWILLPIEQQGSEGSVS